MTTKNVLAIRRVTIAVAVATIGFANVHNRIDTSEATARVEIAVKTVRVRQTIPTLACAQETMP